MSGSRPQHLQRRSGTYHLRVRVPDDLKLRVGLLEVRRSLHVHSLHEARPLALKYAARVLEAFNVAYKHSLTKEQITALLAARFADLKPRWDRSYIPQSFPPDLEIAEQKGFAHERIVDLEDQIERGSFEQAICASAERLVMGSGASFADQPVDVRLDVMTGVARALIEQQRMFIFRLDERLMPYTPNDPLFQGKAVVVIAAGSLVQTEAMSLSGPIPAQVAAFGPTVGELISKYLSANKPGWAPKTYRSRCNQTAYFVEHFGADTRANDLTCDDVRELRDSLCRLRRNHHVGAGKSFKSRQTNDPSKRVTGKTANLLFDTCKAIFRWAKSEGYVASNPADGMAYAIHAKAKVKGGDVARRPFSADELNAVFSAPIYRGFRTPKRPHDPGTLIHSNARYWIPLVAFFTGMRLGEIVQLQISDVYSGGPIPYIEVTEAGGGDHGSGQEKFVKSDAGVRQVPLHPDLIALGFLKFVTRVRKQRKGSGRLFFEVGYGSDGMPSSTFSKWFGRFLEKIGLTDPALVFHSFRHGAEDAFRDALQHEYLIDQIIGHADGKVSSSYGDGVSLETKYGAIKALKFKVNLVPIVGAHQPVGFC